MLLSDPPEYRTCQGYQAHPKLILPPNCYDGKRVGGDCQSMEKAEECWCPGIFGAGPYTLHQLARCCFLVWIQSTFEGKAHREQLPRAPSAIPPTLRVPAAGWGRCTRSLLQMASFGVVLLEWWLGRGRISPSPGKWWIFSKKPHSISRQLFRSCPWFWSGCPDFRKTQPTAVRPDPTGELNPFLEEDPCSSIPVGKSQLPGKLLFSYQHARSPQWGMSP